jgi:hypothetical protein
MSARGKAGIAAAALLVAIVALIIAVTNHLTSTLETTPAPAVSAPALPAPKPSPGLARGRQLRVGLYLSKLTGDQWGYSCQIVNELARGNFELIPILEKDTASEPAIAKLLNQWFPQKAPIDAANVKALETLDVIVAPRIWLVPDDARTAIETAVTHGTGLLARNGIGCMDPGTGPDISRLNGFSESRFGYNPHPMECEVVAAHPLLGALAAGQTVRMTPNGTWGLPAAQTIPLIRIKNMDAFRAFDKAGVDWTFYPLYIARLGKGRIVGCQFPAWSATPRDLMAATGNEFNIRAVRWLANKAQTNVPSTQPAASRAASAAEDLLDPR